MSNKVRKAFRSANNANEISKARKATAVIQKKKKLTFVEAERIFLKKKHELRNSVYGDKVNLACMSGHTSYSPAPMSWVDRECLAKKSNGHKCHKPLFFLQSAMDIPGPKKKVKASKLFKIKRT